MSFHLRLFIFGLVFLIKIDPPQKTRHGVQTNTQYSFFAFREIATQGLIRIILSYYYFFIYF